MHTPVELSWPAHDPRSSLTAATSQGQRVSTGDNPARVKEGASLLADAAEEIGLHLSERIERREHGERQVAAGRSSRRLSIEEITAYLEKSRQDPDPRSRSMRIRDMLQRAEKLGEPLAFTHTPGETPTQRYLLVQEALQTALAEDAPAAVIERLEQVLADMEVATGLYVQADLATIDHAAEFADTAQGIASFQGALHSVLGKPTLVAAFKEAIDLSDKDGNRLDQAIQHLMDALGTCLYALGSTREKALLQALVTDLYHMKCLNTLFEQAQSVVRDIRRALQQSPAAQEPAHASGA